MTTKVNPNKVKYVPIQQEWRRLKRLFESPLADRIWRRNLRDFRNQRADEHKFKYTHDESRYDWPCDHDSCDWRFDHRGRRPDYWRFVCHSACHWLVDLNLYVACAAYPKWGWSIVTHNKHSTVWNGVEKDPWLFDLNFLALGVSPKQAWELASAGDILDYGQFLHPELLIDGFFEDERTPDMQITMQKMLNLKGGYHGNN